jgi:hypothetical protein
MSATNGALRRRGGRPSLAVQAFRQALTLDSFKWAAFQSLCDMGALLVSDSAECIARERRARLRREC